MYEVYLYNVQSKTHNERNTLYLKDKMNRFKDLRVWQEAISIAESIYGLTKNFPSEEKFGLTSQMRRCAVSISSNIAEGAGRNNKKEFNQFIGIALGSAFELESQLIVSLKLGFCKESQADELIEKLNHIQNMLYKLQQSIMQLQA